MHSCKLQETDKNIDIKDIALHIIQTNTSHYNTLSILVEQLKLLRERETRLCKSVTDRFRLSATFDVNPIQNSCKLRFVVV